LKIMRAKYAILLFPVFICCLPLLAFSAANGARKGDEDSGMRGACMKYIFSVIADTGSQNCAEAIKTAGVLGDKTALPLLKRSLKNRNESIKLESACAMAKLEDRSGLPSVSDILREKPVMPQGDMKMKLLLRARTLSRQALRARAAEIIGETGDVSYMPLLRKIAGDDSEDRRVVDNCIASLAKLGDRSRINVFTMALLRKDRDAHRQACYFLGELKEKSAASNISDLMNNWDNDVRAEAVLALGKIGDRDTIPKIRKLLKDPDPGVRMNACRSLGLLNDAAAMPDLRALLEDMNGFVRLGASEALLRMKDESGEKFLMKALKSSDFDARLKATQITSELGTPDMLPELCRIFLEERDELFKLNMAGALVRVEGRKNKQEKNN
jgi:HEAT repeat protein